MQITKKWVVWCHLDFCLAVSVFRNFSSLYLYDLVSCSHESFSKLCIHLSRFPLFEESSTHKDKDNQRYRSPHVQIKFPVLGSTNHPFFSWKKEESHPFFRVCLLAMTFRGNLASCRTHFLGQKKRPLKRQTNRSSDKCCMKMVPLKQCWSSVGVKPNEGDPNDGWVYQAKRSRGQKGLL